MEQEKTIGKYKILREIGRGGMAVVYKAVDPKTQNIVALKVLLPNMVDSSAVERFYREAQSMARLEHPNVIKVSDFGLTKGNHYFAMEFIEGKSLRSIIRQRGPLPINETMDIVVQAGQALAYAHSKGMIHRDIKSGNIMVDKEGRVKVMDFGLVQIPEITRVTTEGSVVGTAEYMSPEQISDGEVDNRSDIYSLGITMYEMLTGCPPFRADTYQAVLMKHKYELPSPMRESRPDIPPELERITMRALAKDAAQRYQKIQEMLDDIDRFRGAQPKVIPRTAEIVESPKEKTAVSKKRKRYTKIIGIILVALAVYFSYRYKQEVPFFISKTIKNFKVEIETEKDLIRKTEELLKRLEMADDYHSRGLKFYKGGLVDMAIAEYKKAISLRRDYLLYYQDLALAYEEKGEKNKAIKAWQDLLKYSPSAAQMETAQQHIEKLRSK